MNRNVTDEGIQSIDNVKHKTRLFATNKAIKFVILHLPMGI